MFSDAMRGVNNAYLICLRCLSANHLRTLVYIICVILNSIVYCIILCIISTMTPRIISAITPLGMHIQFQNVHLST